MLTVSAGQTSSAIRASSETDIAIARPTSSDAKFYAELSYDGVSWVQWRLGWQQSNAQLMAGSNAGRLPYFRFVCVSGSIEVGVVPYEDDSADYLRADSAIGQLAAVVGISQAQVVATILSGNSCISGLFPQNYKNIRKAIANTRLGVSNTNVFMIGDSTYTGLNEGGITNEVAFSTPRQLAALFTSAGLPAGWQNFLGDHSANFSSTSLPVIDTRVSAFASGWVIFGSNGMGGDSIRNGTNQNTFSFTPTVQTDTCEIYYLDGSGYDNIIVTTGTDGATAPTTGGTITTTSTGTFKRAVATYTLGNNVWTVKKATNNTNSISIQGMSCYDSSKKEVGILNLGCNSRRISYFTNATSNFTALSEMTSGVVPNVALAICQIGINDWTQSMTEADFRAQLVTLVNALRAVNIDIVFSVPIPSPTSVATADAQKAIVNAYYSASQELGVALIDITKRWGSYAESFPLGYYRAANDVHGSKLGYYDVAFALRAFFAAIGAV